MQTCPRRMNEFGPWKREADLDTWRQDDSCSFCGSLNPATLMARLEAGTVTLQPTDKNYKVYVQNQGGAPFRQAYRPSAEADRMWTIREVESTKFYFDHLTSTQQERFVELYNQGRIARFYRMPFFMRAA